MSYSAAHCDNSYEGASEYCIPGPDGEISVVNYKNVDYYRLVGDVTSITGYDYVVVDFGVWPDMNALSVCDEIFLCLDPSISIIKKYRSYIKKLERPVDVIMRGYLPDMVAVKKLEHILDEENPFITSFSTLTLSEEDEILRIAMQYRSYRGFLGVSKEMERALLSMCRKVTDMKDSVIYNAYRHARKGECA